MMKMKRFLAALLCLSMLAALSLPAQAAASAECSCGEVVQVFFEGFGEPLYYDEGTPNQRDPGLANTDNITEELPWLFLSIVLSVMFRSWDPLAGGIGSLAMSIMGHLRMDEEGKSVEPLSATWSIDSKQNHKTEPEYRFIFDYRQDPFESAKQLNEFIETLCKKTGHKKVALTGSSAAGIVQMTYLKEYGTKRLDSFLMINSAFQGVPLAGDLLRKEFSVSGPALSNYFSTFGNGHDLLVPGMALLRTSGLLNVLGPASELLMEGMGDRLYANALIPLFGQMPILWAFVPHEDYPEARKLLEGNDKYKSLLAKADRYQYEVQKNAAKLLKQAQKDGVTIAIICGYGFAPYPFAKESDYHCDTLIATTRESGGATVAPFGETLPAAGATQYRSPDNIIDASTCILPNQTWFIKYQKHDTNPSKSLRDWIIHSKKTPTVSSNAKFPQYLFNEGEGVITPLPQGEAAPAPETFVAAAVEFAKAAIASITL